MNSKIQDLSNQSLIFMPQLPTDTETAYLDNNSLTSVSQLPPSIQILSITNNKLSFLPDLHNQVPLLKILNLSNNKLVSIKGLSLCVHIQELVICNNFIGDEEISTLKHLTKLKFLDVSRNHLRSASFVKILKNFRDLEELRNNFNEFESWNMDFTMENLKELVLENNKIQEISFERILPRLEKLLCRQNRINEFFGAENLENLTELDVGDNNLDELPADLVKTSVSVLLCNNNSLTSIPFLPTLEILDASSNSLFKISKFGGKIQEVILANNHLKDLPEMFSVISVNVAYNQFKSTRSFVDCSNLQNLDLSFNPLELPGTIFQDLSGLSLRTLALPELPASLKDQLIAKITTLTQLNKEVIPYRSFVSEKSNFRGSNYWDALSKSRLFPSCRSSMAGATTPISRPVTYNSIFSDIKSTPLNTNTQFYRYDKPQEEVTGRFSIDFTNENPVKELNNTAKVLNTPKIEETEQEQLKTRNKTQERGKKISRKRKICTKVNCKRHKNENLNKSALVDQSTSPFVSQDFSSNRTQQILLNQTTLPDSHYRISNTHHHLNQTTLPDSDYRKPNAHPLNQTAPLNNNPKPNLPRPPQKPKTLSHLFTFARTPPRPVLPHESAIPLTSTLSPSSYEFSLLKELLFLEGYNLCSAAKTYTHSLQKSLEMGLNGSKRAKNFHLVFYYNKADVLQTLFGYCKGFEFVWDNFGEQVEFSVSITRITSGLEKMNTILLCLADPASLGGEDGHIFRCSAPQSVVPVYLIQYS